MLDRYDSALFCFFFFFKQKTAYEMRISDWSSDVALPIYRFHYPSANEKREIIRRENDGHHASEPPLRVSQVEIEPVLKRAIDENPMVTVRFGTAFERIIDQDRDGVTVEISDSETGAIETVRCAFLAGCEIGRAHV